VWQTYTQTFTTPADATELTIFHVLPAVGTLAVDDLSVKPLQIYADVTQIESLEQNGHEIGAHTKTHPSLTTLNTAAKTTEIVGSRQALLTAGFNPVLTLAYPYGSYDDEVQTITAIAGFTSARSVDRGYNDLTTDRYALKIQQVGRTTTPAQITSWIDQAILDKTWLILMFHQISDDVSATLGITQADFQSVVNYTATAAVDTVTISEGVALLP
jgi:peptidoglycan/xylan/chitin deacetylase (PgdA/CDA1 family)